MGVVRWLAGVWAVHILKLCPPPPPSIPYPPTATTTSDGYEEPEFPPPHTPPLVMGMKKAFRIPPPTHTPHTPPLVMGTKKASRIPPPSLVTGMKKVNLAAKNSALMGRPGPDVFQLRLIPDSRRLKSAGGAKGTCKGGRRSGWSVCVCVEEHMQISAGGLSRPHPRLCKTD